jgi:hypothetical protein
MARADERGIDWKSKIETLPQDDEGLIIVFLASFLGLTMEGALDQDKTLDELEQEREQLERGGAVEKPQERQLRTELFQI